MSAHLSQRELETHLWGAATLLRGLIDASDYKQYIFPLMFLKRLSDVYDEEYEQALVSSGGDKDFARPHLVEILGTVQDTRGCRHPARARADAFERATGLALCRCGLRGR